MEDKRYEKLNLLREEIQTDREKAERFQERAKERLAKMYAAIRAKERRLKEEEASRIVADVGELKLTPEELGRVLSMIKAGQIYISDAQDEVAHDENTTENIEEDNDEE